MPGYLESILDISESCDYFLPWNVVKEKLILAGRGAIKIGAVTIMTMISFKQSIALDMYFHFHQ